jgi:hypothetical protein
MTREERFQEQQRLQKEAEKRANQSMFKPYKHPEYVALEKGKLIVLRPMSYKPAEDWELTEGTANRFYWQTWMLADDKKSRFPFNWGFEPWSKHPIYDLVKVVASGTFNQENRTMKYDNEGCSLLLDITTNSNPSNIMDRGWRGNKFALMNVIDRMDNWCVENKHSKVLVKDATWNEENKTWNATPGAPTSIYNEIVEISKDNSYPMDGVDFAVIRHSEPKKVGDKDIYYNVYLGDQSRVISQYNTPELDYSKIIIMDDTTEEELNYEQYDFSEMPLYRRSSVSYFMRKKKGFVKDVDKKYHTHFFEQFSEIMAQEKEAYAQASQEAQTTSVVKEQEISSTDREVPTEDIEVPNPADIKSNSPVREVASSDDLKIDTSIFKGYDLLSDDEKSQIRGVGDNQDLIFVESANKPEACDVCKFMFPISFKHCPKCGQAYK